MDLSNIRFPSLNRRIIAVLEKHIGTYTATLGTIKETEHGISPHLETNQICQQPYPAGTKSRIIIEQKIQTQLDATMIEPVKMDWDSPVILVLKND